MLSLIRIWYWVSLKGQLSYSLNISNPYISDIVDQFIQQWSEEMRRSSMCDVYREFKTELKFESYLCNIEHVNHRLPVETGRYLKLERNWRVCNFCGNGDLGDEYHYLFV